MVKVGDYIYIPKNNTINLDEVIKVETVDYNGHIYDLTVEDNHTYIAGKTKVLLSQTVLEHYMLIVQMKPF